MDKCPRCGHEEYYIKRKYNGRMFDYADVKEVSKYAWCCNCDKRLFKLEEE